MSTTSYMLQFEADETQPLPDFTYRYREERLIRPIKPTYARVHFEIGDFTDYLDWIAAINAALTANNQIISEMFVDSAGGRIGGGFWFSVVPIAGTMLITQITVGDTVYDITTVPVYTGDRTLTLNIYKNGSLDQSIDVKSNKPFRTGVSGKDIKWQFELTGNVESVSRLDVATNVDEIKFDTKTTTTTTETK